MTMVSINAINHTYTHFYVTFFYFFFFLSFFNFFFFIFDTGISLNQKARKSICGEVKQSSETQFASFHSNCNE